MFKIGVQTGDLDLKYGIDTAYRMIKEAGFDAVDCSFDHLMSGEYYAKHELSECLASPDEKAILEWAKPYAEASIKYGIDNYQAHAPFPSMLTGEKDVVFNRQLLEMQKKVIVAMASINCHNLIIHPFFCDYSHTMTRQEEWDLNLENYMELAPVAKKYDVKIMLENMFVGRSGKIYAAICNEGREANTYVEELNRLCGEQRFGFCFDTGHALLVGLDVRKFMNDVGDNLLCFHVHDNDGVNDCHQAPYTGKLDWGRFIGGLNDIRFNRTMCFETFNALRSVPEELIPQTLKYIASCGRYFDRCVSKKEN